MTDVFNHGTDVNQEQFAMDLDRLAFELRNGDVYVTRGKVSHDVESTEEEKVVFTLEVVPTTESRFAGGYTIPFQS